MNVAMLRLELLVIGCPTLHEKRRRIRAMIDKLHRHFNVSVAEVDRYDPLSEAVLGVAAVGATRKQALDMLDRVTDAVGAHPRAQLVGHAIREA